jgi:hypothetical protein
MRAKTTTLLPTAILAALSSSFASDVPSSSSGSPLFSSSAASAPMPAAAPRSAALTGDLPPQFAQAKSLLEANQGAEALAKAKEGLEFAPDSVELLDLASRAAALAGENDQALWYASLALEPAGAGKDKLQAEIQKRTPDLDPQQQKNQAVMTAYAQVLLQLGQRCADKKLFVSAVELLNRCRGTPLARDAEAALAKIYDNKAAVEALLSSGLDVPIKSAKKRSTAEIAKEDKKHSTWENAYQKKGKCYTVMTDMGGEIAEQMSSAMEQINQFYRKTFHVKQQGGDTARVTIKVFKSRAEFDKFAQEKGDPAQSPGVKGFFSSSALKVCTYDTREDGFPPSFLWSTLFHEASHQFTALMAPSGAVPTWLNEGTASYFEGARLLPNGTVETNLVPEGRLSELKLHLKEGAPTLKDVVTFYQPGSYPGEYYPFGWGLAYFLNNYEDENSVRAYKPLYHEYMLAYKSGAKHDVLGRFVEYFVTKAKQPGVTTFEDFEKRWKEWILKLDEIYFGPPSTADVLIARARKERADKQPESAIESYKWALRKRPGDIVACFELGELMAELKQDDAALFNAERALELARSLDDPTKKLPGGDNLTGAEVIERARDRIAKIDKNLSEALGAADATLLASAAETAKSYSEHKFPLCALRLLDQAQAAMGPSPELGKLRVEIATKSGAETRRWRRLPISSDLAEWEAGDHWKSQGDKIAGQAGQGTLALCFWRDELPERFSFEVKVDASRLEGQSMVGLFFGAGGRSVQIVGAFPGGDVEAIVLKQGLTPLKLVGHVDKSALSGVRIGVDVSKDAVAFSIDGKPAGKQDYSPADLEGQIGLAIYNGTGDFSELKIRY